MTDDYAPPQHVINEWIKLCHCCRNCSPWPCDGAMSSGICDNASCECQEWDNQELDDDQEFF